MGIEPEATDGANKASSRRRMGNMDVGGDERWGDKLVGTVAQGDLFSMQQILSACN